jgi:SNF2 family DNA or RNA helicase
MEFRELGHAFTRIDGSMNPQERIDAMEAFETERCDTMAHPRFILCSLHACGTGINLTRGNVVFMLDPWWNVAAENQGKPAGLEIRNHDGIFI